MQLPKVSPLFFDWRHVYTELANSLNFNQEKFLARFGTTLKNLSLFDRHAIVVANLNQLR